MDKVDDLSHRLDHMESKFNDAFVGGDHHGHKQAHGIMVENLRSRERLISLIKEKTVVGLVWSLMIFIGLASWKYILTVVRGF